MTTADLTDRGKPQDGPPLPDWSWPYWAAMLAIVAAAVALLEWQYGMAPLPPGNDTGHWLWTANAYLGRPTPPAGAVGSPFSVPPVPFVILAICLRIAGDPFTGIALFSGVMMAAFGLTVIHVARTYTRHPPFGVLMVGLVMFNGTILSMLFWGGFPNFTGLVFLEESMAGALLFVRSGRLRDALILYGALSLTFLSHDLSFVLALGGVVLGALFLWATGLLDLRFLVRSQNLAGVALLVGVVGVFTGVTRALAIPRPGFINTNPATYVIANIGQIFNPITLSGSTTPTYEIPVALALAVLLLTPIVLFFALVWLRFGSLRPGPRPSKTLGSAGRANGVGAPWVDAPLVMSAGWLAGTFVVPAVGYLAHVDTDYLRFGFFLPVAFLPLTVVVLERLMEAGTGYGRPAPKPAAPVTDPAPTGDATPAPVPAPTRPERAPGIPRPWFVLHGVVLVVVVLVAAGYGLPVAQSSERVNIQNAHDSQFLDAVSFLQQSNAAGAVLTYDGATRWVQALTARAAFDSAPTWELFFPYQIIDGQEAYYALNSVSTVTDNHAALMYSGVGVPSLAASPLYSVLLEGIPFPMFRITPAETSVNVTARGVTTEYSVGNLPVPSIRVAPGPEPSVTTSYAGPGFYYNETDQLAGDGGAYLNVTVTPAPGSSSSIASYSYGLAPPSGADPILHAAKPAGISTTADGFVWQMSGRLGQIPGSEVVSTTGTFSVAPNNVSLPTKGVPNLLIFSFDGNGSGPQSSSLFVTTPDTGNPAVQLETVLTTSEFIATHDIHFVLLPDNPVYQPTIEVFETELGFQVAYQNSEWVVMEG